MKAAVTVLMLILLPPVVVGIDVIQKGEQVIIDEQTADSLLSRADELFQTREYQKALELYGEAAESARKEFNRSVEVEAMAQVARMNLVLGNKEEGRSVLTSVGEKAVDSDPMGWTRYLGVRGRFEWQDDDLKTARGTFDEMYEYCTANALWGRAVDAAHMIAIVAETPEEQIEWSQRGIEAAEAAEQENWLGPLWNNMAITYFDMKKYDTALTCFEKAREYHWRHSGEVAKLFADYHVGMTHRYLGNYEESGRWLRPVLAWAERIENHSAIGQACEDLGEAAIGQGHKAEGLKLLKRARDEYKIEGYDKSWTEIWDGINKRIAELQK